MITQHPPEVLKLLSHDLRWQLVQHLASSDYRVQELVELIQHPLNLVSYHLKQLREGQLVSVRRSEADGRDAYYSLDLDYLRQQYTQAGHAIHPAISEKRAQQSAIPADLRVIFVGTHNSARSQMAEGLLRHLSAGKVTVTSAGTDPGLMHPDALRTMDALGIDIRAQYPKTLDSLRDQSFDLVITVCDRARETCPTFAGNGQHWHWGFPDPTRIQEARARQQAFLETAQRLQTRIQALLLEQSGGQH